MEKKLWIELYTWDTAIVSPGRALYTGKNLNDIYNFGLSSNVPDQGLTWRRSSKEYKENERKVGWWNAREQSEKKNKKKPVEWRAQRIFYAIQFENFNRVGRSLGLGGVTNVGKKKATLSFDFHVCVLTALSWVTDVVCYQLFRLVLYTSTLCPVV